MTAVVTVAWSARTTAQPGPTFSVNPPGNIKDGYGTGSRDYTLYAPNIRFPIDATKTIATPNSQLRNPGGMFGGGGSQCTASNFNEVWWDTYCERRDGTNRASLNCGRRDIHQGVDIRGGTSQTCRELESGKRDNVPVVAVSNGVIDRIGSYSVDLKTDHGFYRYLHLHMRTLQVSRGDHVKAGQLIGYMFNDFGGEWTTYHLHFEHWMPFAGKGTVPTPVYCDLVLAYERDTGKRHVITDGSRPCGGPLAQQGAPVAQTPAQPAPATAEAVSYWRHNGSDMKLLIRGAKRTFTYETPNPGLRDLVKPGTVLFEGERTGNNYKGTAYLLSSSCPPTAYSVDGFLDDGGRTIVLNGQRPVLGPDCKPARSTPDRLVFLFQREEASAPTGPVGGEPQGPTASSPGPNRPPITVSAGLAPACTRARCVDREPFLRAFSEYYRTHDRRTLNRWQEDALTAMLNVWDTTAELESERRLAYILGTAYHESTHTLYPTRECSCKTDAGAIACSKRLYEAGKASPYYLRDSKTGHSYYGRGQTQLTLKENFDRIGKNLGLGTRLVQMPDEALTLEVSAKNSVLGLYHGWYRAVNGKWLGLKHISFDSDDDWVRARDVLIAQRRAADDVANFSRAMLRMLNFIPLADFERKYGQPPASEPRQQTPTPPPAPQGPVVAQPPPRTEPSPPPALPSVVQPTQPPSGAQQPTIDAALLGELQRRAQGLDEMARDLTLRSLDLSRQIAVLRGMLEATTIRADSPGAPKALDEDEKAEAAAVNFQDAWPPSHKEHAWCRTRDDGKALPTFDELPDDDPLVIRFGR
jgi:murein DD-endopeptidase MepM/ murein hydrolase activator NlpD